MNVRQFTLRHDEYTINFEDGRVIKAKMITSEGQPRKNDHHFDHVIHYSDGVMKRAVLSTQIAVLPDCSLLD